MISQFSAFDFNPLPRSFSFEFEVLTPTLTSRDRFFQGSDSLWRALHRLRGPVAAQIALPNPQPTAAEEIGQLACEALFALLVLSLVACFCVFYAPLF